MDMIGQLNLGCSSSRSSGVVCPDAVGISTTIIKPIGGLDSVKKITSVEANEVKVVVVLAKMVGVGKRKTVDKPVISARSFKDD